MNRMRAAWDILTQGYDAAFDSRFRTPQAWNRSIDASEDAMLGPSDRMRIALECWDLYRNNEVGRAIGDRFPEYVVWQGLMPHAKTSDTAWNERAESWYRQIYMPTCDYRQQAGVDAVAHQRMVVRNALFSPGCGFILLKNGQVQPVEGEQIQTPFDKSKDKNVTEGVRTTAKGIVIGYYVCPRRDGGAVDRTKSTFVRREDFLHCWMPHRFAQQRHVPMLAACVNKLRDYDETDRYVLNKVKADATRLWKEIRQGGMPNEGRRGAYTKTNDDGKEPTKVSKGEWGTVWHGSQGEDLQEFEGKTPNTQYVPYMKHQLQTIAASLGVSYQIILLMFTEGSFSQERAAMMHNKHAFLIWHDWLVRVLERRRWNWRIAKAIKDGVLPAAPTEPVYGFDGQTQVADRSQWYKVDFSLPFFDWVDPDKESKSKDREYKAGRSSLKHQIASTGRDRDDVLREKGDDIAHAIAVAEQVNTDNPGAGVTWRDIIQTNEGQAPMPVEVEQ